MNKPQFTGKIKIGKTTFNKTERWDTIADGLTLVFCIGAFVLMTWIVMG